MRALFFSLTLCLVLAGCDDAIGFGGSCTREMREVQRQRGRPDSQSSAQVGGNYTETWRYGNRAVIFRWGITIDGCDVQDTSLASMIRLPV